MNGRESKLRFGFTLIELLVVIVIAVILLVLLLSGIQRAKEEALSRHCVDNLKGVGLAFRQWAIDSFDGHPMQLRKQSLDSHCEHVCGLHT
jgi:prepilin-type N-terminal cleavage/methylation domain-containing protein